MMFATRQELFQVGRRQIAITPNTKLNPAVADIPGSDLNIVIGAFAVMGEEVASRGARAMRGAFAELARGAALDRVIYDRSGLLRFGATPAKVDLVLARAMPATPTPGTYSAGSVVQSKDGVQFALDRDAVFGDYTLSVSVAAHALIAGAEGNVAAANPGLGLGVIAFSTTPFDATLTVGNPKPAAGGTDKEEDIPFLGRYRAFFPTLSRGVLGAIEFGAMQVAGVAVATASEILNPSSGFPAAAVQLVIGDADGNATSAMVAEVSDKLLGYRAAGIPVSVLTGEVVYQSVAWSPAFQVGFDETLVVERIRAVTVAVAQFLPPGPDRGILLRSKLIAAAQQVPGAIIRDSSLRYPLGDVVPTSAMQMIRVLPQGVTFG